MKVLFDTHFLLWVVMDSPRLGEFPWLDQYRPWGVSPVSFLELQFLTEVGRLEVRQPDFTRAVSRDPRFVVDEAPLVGLIEKALPLEWTRDPFDRLIAAHSTLRRVSLCTLDRKMLAEHTFIVQELRES